MIRLAGSFALALAVSLAMTPPNAAHAAAVDNASDKIGATPAPSGPPPTPESPAGGKAVPVPPTLPGMASYVLMDGTTGAILAQAAPDLKIPPASLTKLMTMHIVYQALHHGAIKLDQTVPVSVEAWHAGGSSMFIQPASVVTVDQLLHGLIIDSGNDAAIALAEQVAGSQAAFVQLMNQQAQKLGLSDTHYTNVTGLPDPDLRTTALDVAKLTRAILQDEPEVLNIAKLPSYTYNNITQASWNPVLKVDPTVDGLKTGLTREAGHCIDATAIRNGMRLIAVVTGGPTWHASTAAIESLLGYGERFFTDDTVAKAGQPIETLKSDALEPGSVAVGTQKDLTITLPTSAAAKVTHSVAYSADLSKGVKKGEPLGTVTYTLNGQTIGSAELVALADAPPASFFTRWKRKLGNML